MKNNNYCIKAEMHCHIKSNKLGYAPFLYDAVDSIEEMIEAAVKMNLKILAITDHDSIDNCYKAKEYISKNNIDLLIVNGSEVSTKCGHLLAYGINKAVKPNQGIRETIDEIHAQGGIAVASHPYNMFFSLRNIIKNMPLDGIEVFNATSTAKANNKAFEWATKNNIPGTAGSDAHSAKGLGHGIMYFRKEVDSEIKVIAAIKAKDFDIESSFYNWDKVLVDNLVGNFAR